MSGTSSITVLVSPDRMLAVVTINAAEAPAGVPVARLAAAIEQAGVRPDPEFLKRLAALETSGENLVSATPVVVARGTPPQQPRAPQLQPVAPPSQDHLPEFQRCKLPIARAGQRLALILTAQPGAAGIDVLGQALPFTPVGRGYELKRGVKVSEDGQWVEATVSGMYRVNADSAEVEAGLSIPADVDLSTGSINFDGDVTIGRNVLDRFEVLATGMVTVQGSVEAATVRAKDLVVERGIVCKDRGRCEATGNIRARHATNADVFAGGDIEIHGEAANCRLTCRGTLRCPSGAISGGVASGFSGVVAGTIGSPAGVRTLVEVGFDGELLDGARREQAEIGRMLARASELRGKTAPLLQHQRNLTAQQKELVTELLFEAEELESSAKQRREKFCACAENTAAAVEFGRCIHAGVIVRWSDVEALIPADIPGPGTLRRVATNGELGVVAVGRSGREFRLKSRAVIGPVRAPGSPAEAAA